MPATATRRRKAKPHLSIWERLWHDRKSMAVHFLQSTPSSLEAVDRVVKRTMQLVGEMG